MYSIDVRPVQPSYILRPTTFLDFAFGKCLQNAESDPDETSRVPLTEEESHALATMLEELRGAGLGWEDLFVQCRMQGAIFSIRHKLPMPPNLCANLAPPEEGIKHVGTNDAVAVVHFSPPDDAYAEEVYYPPLKKNFENRLVKKNIVDLI